MKAALAVLEPGDARRCTRATRSPPWRPSPKSRRDDAHAPDQGASTRCCRTLATVDAGAAARARRPSSRAATSGRRSPRKSGDLDAGFKAAAHIVEGDLRDAGADARLPRDARLRLRVGRRQADGVGLDAGRARHARRLRRGAQDPAGERPRHHRVHGRRLRQQVRPRRAGRHLREAGEEGRRAGEADARPQGRASRHAATVRRPTRRSRRASTRRRHARRVRRGDAGARAARRRARASRCRTSTRSRTAAGATRTSSPTPASSARCARRAIRRAASSPRS